MKITEDHVIVNELMDVNTIVFDAYWTLLVPSGLKIRDVLKDFSANKQKEIYNLIKSAQDFDSVLDAIPFPSKKKKEAFIYTIQKDLERIVPYDDSFPILSFLKDRYQLIIDSNLIPPYDIPITDNFWKVVDEIIFSFQEQYSKWKKKHYDNLKKKLWKTGDEILFVWDSMKNDYEYPKRNKMNALHLQRNGKTHVESIETLEELLTLLKIKP